MVNEAVEGVEAEFIGADEDDMASDPQHGEGADDGEEREQLRHGLDEESSELLLSGGVLPRHMQTDVIHLHDERDDTVDTDGDRKADDGENDCTARQGLTGHLVEGDDHDLAAEDEVGGDGRPNDLLLCRCTIGRLLGGWSLLLMVSDPPELLEDLLGALKAQVGAADHEQRSQQPRKKLTEQQNDREDDDELVEQRSERDAFDDRKLTLRVHSFDEFRRHRRIVDDDSRSFGTGS